jgi:hypothetical protein
MRFSITIAVLVPFALSKATYESWKGYSIDTLGMPHGHVTNILSGINHIPLGEHKDRAEVAVHPTSISKFEGLALNSTLFIDDMGEELAKEGNFEKLTR